MVTVTVALVNVYAILDISDRTVKAMYATVSRVVFMVTVWRNIWEDNSLRPCLRVCAILAGRGPPVIRTRVLVRHAPAEGIAWSLEISTLSANVKSTIRVKLANTVHLVLDVRPSTTRTVARR